MILKLSIYILFTIFLCSCSAKNPIGGNNKKAPDSSSSACSSSEARSSALRRLWNLYGKKDIRLPYQVKSKGEFWDVQGTRNKATSQTVHVVIPKSSDNCSVVKLFHKQVIYDLRGPKSKEPSETRKKLREYMKNSEKLKAPKNQQVPRPCTVIGCSNQVRVNLLNPLKPGIYTFKINRGDNKIK